MGTQNKLVRRGITAIMVTSTLISQAQLDDYFPPPPPPPPPPGFGNVNPGTSVRPLNNLGPAPGSPSSSGSPSNSGSGFNSSTGASSKKNSEDGGLLSTQQKDKFAKAGIEDITNENFPETIESFDFPNADIGDIVKAISELTGKNFILDNGVKGKITIIAPSKITVAEAYKAFLSALAINGMAIVPSGKFLKIRQSRKAQRDSIETYSGTYFPNSDQMITRIIHLKHIQAEVVNSFLQLTSAEGEMKIYPPTNSLIISDYGTNVERIMKILTQLDVPGFEDHMEVIQVHYAKAKDIADLIDKIVNKGDKNANASRPGGGFTSGVPNRFGAPTSGSSGKAGAYFMVIPDDRTNSLIVSGNHAGLEKIKELLKQLDFRIRPEDRGGVHVYYVKYGTAEDIVKTLQGVIKDSGPKPSTGGMGPSPIAVSPTQGLVQAQEIFGGEVKMNADKATNSIVTVASKQDYEIVLNILARLDIPRDQVFVEAVIMEMNVNDSMDYGVGYFQYAVHGGGAKSGFNGISPSSPNSMTSILGSPAGGAGAILGFAGGDTVDITPPGQTTPVTFKSLVGFLTFLKKNQNANVLSKPQILVMDNQEATIEVGDQVVTSVDAITSTNGGPTIQKPNLGDAKISLKIKPFVSPASNSVRMELDQQVSQLGTAQAPKAVADSFTPIAKRNIKTNIVINSGDTAVLGGLMKENETEDITKVPLLGDIPIIGWLFKSKSSSKSKTNLSIFLTPNIIRTPHDQEQNLNRQLGKRLDFIKGAGGIDPFGKMVDELQKKDASLPNPKVTK